MSNHAEEHNPGAPHADKLRRFRIGRWVTDCRLAKGWTMVDIVVRLHSAYPETHLGNQGRIAELETGNGVNRERWTPEVIEFLHSLFQPCPPPPDDPWGPSDEYLRHLREQDAASEARHQAELARQQGRTQPGLDAMWTAPPEADAA